MSKDEPISKEEQKLTERIFNLYVSLRILQQGRCPFIKEAEGLILKKIKQLKHGSNI